MGNAIKNYERKKRREKKEAQKEIRQIVHDTLIRRMGLSSDFVEKEREIFDYVNDLKLSLGE